MTTFFISLHGSEKSLLLLACMIPCEVNNYFFFIRERVDPQSTYILEYNSACPLSELEPPPPLPHASVYPPPPSPTKGGGNTIGRLEKKLSTLSTLWGYLFGARCRNLNYFLKIRTEGDKLVASCRAHKRFFENSCNR
jgi:hypothetical protein